jgi:proteasome lid subunit RPN8/RPN11
MKSRPVVLSDGARAALERAAAEAAPLEMVGLLAGTGDAFAVQRFVPVTAATCTEDCFTIPAPVFAAAEAVCRAGGERWLGFAHSHPRGSTALSAADRASLWRDCLQLVVVPGDCVPGNVVRGESTTQIGAYWLTRDRIHALAIVRAARETATPARPWPQPNAWLQAAPKRAAFGQGRSLSGALTLRNLARNARDCETTDP